MAMLSMLASAFVAALNAAETAPAAVRPYESDAPAIPRGRLDELVFARLKERGIRPANPCADAVFMRRAFLDVIGTLPTPDEARLFLDDRSPVKRRALIDRLLARSEFADYMAMRWGDLLRIKAEFPINLWPNAAQAYHRWIRAAVAENMPYDRFTRELLTASGSNFRVPQVNFYRAVQSRQPEGIAQTIALTFMGTRADKWPGERLAGMAAFFTRVGYKSTGEWKEEIVFFDPGKAAEGSAHAPVFPDGTPASVPPDRDGREVFADWLLAPQNPWFARAEVNRVWWWLFGRGIIEEPDDIRSDNPPSHPEVLAYLERELVAAKYDLKHIFRVILSSTTYQLSPVRASDHPDGEALFAHYPLRRLEAEVLIDALNQITGTTEKYSSAIPEPFTFVPESVRAIALPDGSIRSPFLETFGRPARDTGFASERSNRPSASQRLALLNSSQIQRKLEQSPVFRALMQSGRRPSEVVDELYLAILSRFPTDAERAAIAGYAGTGREKRREAVIDLAWALINGPEFLYRH